MATNVQRGGEAEPDGPQNDADRDKARTERTNPDRQPERGQDKVKLRNPEKTQDK